MLTWLLSVPGASKTVLEARIPYGGGKSMAEILAKEPQTYACTLTAVDMARAAYRQAAHLSEFGVPILGVSCTCALATDRVKKGDHKARPSACSPLPEGFYATSSDSKPDSLGLSKHQLMPESRIGYRKRPARGC